MYYLLIDEDVFRLCDILCGRLEPGGQRASTGRLTVTRRSPPRDISARRTLTKEHPSTLVTRNRGRVAQTQVRRWRLGDANRDGQRIRVHGTDRHVEILS